MEKIKLLEKNIEKRTKCIVYTRVMGYHRPVESFNPDYAIEKVHS